MGYGWFYAENGETVILVGLLIRLFFDYEYFNELLLGR